MSVEVVVNPVHPEAREVLDRVRQLCARVGVPVHVRRTSIARPHADAAAGADLTVVVGGDGTLREVAGRLVPDPAWTGVLLPVPTGTASLFALNAGIDSQAQGLALLEEWLAGTASILRCDVGWADLERPGGARTGDLPFLVTAGLGRSGSTVQGTPGWAKARLGAAGYGVGALAQLGAAQMRLQIDETAPGGVWAVEFGLIRRIPWGITVFPHGGIATGTLAGLLVTFGESGDGLGGGVLRLLRRTGAWARIARAGLRGGHEQVRALRLWTTTSARVAAAWPVAAHLDGEAAGMIVSARLRVSAGALPVVVPVDRTVGRAAR